MNCVSPQRMLLGFVTVVVAIAGCACFMMASGARADSPIFEFATEPSTTQAGGHPDILTKLKFGNRDTQNFPTECFCQDPKNIKTSFPPGVIGNPHATPQCTRIDFGVQECPPSTQVGWARIDLFDNFFSVPVFNLEPDLNQAGLIGLFAPLANAPLFLVLSARTGSDYGLDSTLTGVEHIVPPEGVELHLWGVPADHSHDAERAPIFSNPAGCSDGPWPCFPPLASNAEVIPFLDNPTTCGGPLTSSLEIVAYDHGVTNRQTTWPAITGCGQLSFNPSLFAQPTAKVTDAASGLDVDLTVPQLVSPTTPSPSEIRSLSVALPVGMSINPNAADGKTSCTDVEARFGTEEESQCPENSKVGTVQLTSSALPAPLPGYIYIGEPKPGERYRIILTANGFDTHVKLAGIVEPDPTTGQLTASFRDLPQSPFSDFNLHFFGSERGLLATPTQCGTYPVESTFTPWDEALSTQSSTQFFNLNSGPGGGPCPESIRPFDPTFEAGVSDATAKAFSPFSLELTRPDGDQNLTGLTVQTPPGFSASLKGIPYCSDEALALAAGGSYSGLAEQAAPSCPAASRIGVANAGVGAGTHPLYLSGAVYLAGPYKGAPLSLAVITPAVSGPFDLGNVVVRASLAVDPITAQITATSDLIPQIVQGIPLRLRSILIELNRSNFTINPTNCDPFGVNASVSGDQGASTESSAHFQAANCATLPFAPKLSLKLGGSIKQAGNPSLTATLTASPDEANISRTQVALPAAELIDQSHINNLCTRVQFNQGKVPGEDCPPSSILGSAQATTPLLDGPLQGPIYLRSTGQAGLPDVVAALNGQIDIVLIGHVDSVSGHLRTTFETVPDAPVTKVVLKFAGGQKGLLENSPELCDQAQHFSAVLNGQNGKMSKRRARLSTPCRKAAKRPARVHLNRRAER